MNKPDWCTAPTPAKAKSQTEPLIQASGYLPEFGSVRDLLHVAQLADLMLRTPRWNMRHCRLDGSTVSLADNKLKSQTQCACCTQPRVAESPLDSQLAVEQILLLHVALPVPRMAAGDAIDQDTPAEVQTLLAGHLPRQGVEQSRLA